MWLDICRPDTPMQPCQGYIANHSGVYLPCTLWEAQVQHWQLVRAVSMHLDDQGHDALMHYAALKGLRAIHCI